jgi:hypothetical protein
MQREEQKCGQPTLPKTVETIIEPYDDGWSDYEEPFIDVQTL